VDFSFEALRPGEVVVWNGQIEKQQRDAAIKPAPVVADESRPNIHIREHVIDERIVRVIRGEWGIGP
jgi:hypothetical protein